MKKVFTLLASTALLGAAATSSMADDEIGPGEAVSLQETGTVKPYAELDKTALQDHPGGTIEDTELENSYGRYIYKVDLRDKDGKEWDVDIDATTGEVLNNQQDD